MTKAVRIENADTGPCKVIVEVWKKGWDDEPDRLLRQEELPYPTAMTSHQVYLTADRYIVIREESAK